MSFVSLNIKPRKENLKGLSGTISMVCDYFGEVSAKKKLIKRVNKEENLFTLAHLFKKCSKLELNVIIFRENEGIKLRGITKLEKLNYVEENLKKENGSKNQEILKNIRKAINNDVIVRRAMQSENMLKNILREGSPIITKIKDNEEKEKAIVIKGYGMEYFEYNEPDEEKEGEKIKYDELMKRILNTEYPAILYATE